MSQKNRQALVIGANGSIGTAIIDRLMSENISVIGADLQADSKTAGIPYFRVDIADEESVHSLYQSAVNTSENIDIVVNCSGILEQPIASTDITLSDFMHTMNVNLVGSFLVSKVFIPILLKSSAGRLIHFSSMLGAEGGPGLTAYSASKAGIIGLVKSLGKEYAKSDLTINAVAPSAVNTEMLMSLSEERVKNQVGLIPMGRAAKVQEVAHLVNYIASEQTSFSTGYIFDLSGGRSVY